MTAFDPRPYWPDGPRNQLLRTAFHTEPAVARAAWSDWEDGVDFDSLVWPEMRLFAFVAERLETLGVTPVHGPRITGMRRQLWALSTTILRAADPALHVLHAAGIPMLVFKGAERIYSQAGGPSRRCIADVDILVPRDRLEAAIDCLEGHGWHNDRDVDPAEIKALLGSSRHSVGFRGPGKGEIDLHGQTLLLNMCPDHDSGLWSRAVSVAGAPVPILGPSPADRLVIAAGHGLIHDPAGSLDWVGDAVQAIADPAMDWQVFEEEIGRRRLPVHAVALLTYLAERLGQPVPDDLVSRLEAAIEEPLVSEFRGHALNWDARDRPDRRVRGDAMRLRARDWWTRAQPAADGGQDAGPSEGGWKPVRRVGKFAGVRRVPVDIPLSDRMSEPGATVRLEIRFASLTWRVEDNLGFALVAFDPHRVEIGRAQLGLLDRKLLRLKRATIGFDVEAAFLAAYHLEALDVEFMTDESLRRSQARLGRIEYRWRLD